MMFGNRLRLTGDLELLTDLHLGSGERDERERTEPDGERETYELSLVQRGVDGRAVIPGTSLKGAMRAAALTARLGKGEIADLFGPLQVQGAKEAKIGRLWIHAALRKGNADRRDEVRGLTRDGGSKEDGFERIHVRLHRTTGASEAHLLYSEELIAKGERFGFEALLLLDDTKTLTPGDALVETLTRAFQPLLREEGLGLGAGTRMGDGRVRLLGDTLKVELSIIDPPSGRLVPTLRSDLASALNQRASLTTALRGRRWTLRLVCDGPFISMARRDAKDAEGREITTPLERDGKPVLWPTSLLGALRARAAWLAEVEWLRAEKAGHKSRFAPGRPLDEEIDRRSHVLTDRKGVAKLSSVERLFGVTGWRGELHVRSLRFTGPVQATHTAQSVSVDRFTGGARDGALFGEKTYLNPEFEAVLDHEARGDAVPDEQRRADAELLELLWRDLARNTLFLGHGAAKGFGWFKVTVASAQIGGGSGHA